MIPTVVMIVVIVLLLLCIVGMWMWSQSRMSPRVRPIRRRDDSVGGNPPAGDQPDPHHTTQPVKYGRWKRAGRITRNILLVALIPLLAWLWWTGIFAALLAWISSIPDLAASGETSSGTPTPITSANLLAFWTEWRQVIVLLFAAGIIIWMLNRSAHWLTISLVVLVALGVAFLDRSFLRDINTGINGGTWSESSTSPPSTTTVTDDRRNASLIAPVDVWSATELIPDKSCVTINDAEGDHVRSKINIEYKNPDTGEWVESSGIPRSAFRIMSITGNPEKAIYTFYPMVSGSC